MHHPHVCICIGIERKRIEGKERKGKERKGIWVWEQGDKHMSQRNLALDWRMCVHAK